MELKEAMETNERKKLKEKRRVREIISMIDSKMWNLCYFEIINFYGKNPLQKIRNCSLQYRNRLWFPQGHQGNSRKKEESGHFGWWRDHHWKGRIWHDPLKGCSACLSQHSECFHQQGTQGYPWRKEVHLRLWKGHCRTSSIVFQRTKPFNFGIWHYLILLLSQTNENAYVFPFYSLWLIQPDNLHGDLGNNDGKMLKHRRYSDFWNMSL